MRQIFFNCNYEGEMPVSVAIYSLLKASDPSKPITIHVAHDTRFEEQGSCEKLRSVVARFPFASIKFANFDPVFKANEKVIANKTNHWTPMVWAWVFCTDLFPELHGNIVFIDWDMYVRKDLEELYTLDLPGEGMITAAVNESRREHRPYLVAAGWPEEAGYSVNTGFQVIDTDAYRKERVKERILEWYDRYRDIAANVEQDAINVAIGPQIKRMHVKYNYTVGWLERIVKYNVYKHKEWRVFPTVQVIEAMVDPTIVHFIGHRKPWRVNYRPFRHVYRAAMKELGYLEGGSLPGENIFTRIGGVFADFYHWVLLGYARLLLSTRFARQRTPA